MTTKSPWERPHLLSVSIPVVEELLAQSYKRKAELWADAAKRLREVTSERESATRAPGASSR